MPLQVNMILQTRLARCSSIIAISGFLACSAPSKPHSAPHSSSTTQGAASSNTAETPKPEPSAQPLSSAQLSSSAQPSLNTQPSPTTSIIPTPARSPSASGLIGRYPAFAKIRSGERLQIGSSGPIVAAVQGILLLWNYPLTPTDVTGQFDEKTAQAVLHYRIDVGLTEIPARGTFDAVARERGVFDAAALEQFQSRMEAANYREIQAIDPARGVLFHVPLWLRDERALGAGFQHYLKVLDKRPQVVSRDDPDHDPQLKAAGKRAAWVPLNEYACVAASRHRGSCSP